ncbi:hypothetical protein HYT57_05075 [Candidatus Woesearchaeota archaeon]|nr:hypothetical protein [Candidatus Woesearchaeota archaeon]
MTTKNNLRNTIQADSLSQRVRLTDDEGGELTLYGFEEVSTFIKDLLSLVPLEDQEFYTYERRDATGRITGTFIGLVNRTEEIVCYLREAQDIIVPRNYLKLF